MPASLLPPRGRPRNFDIDVVTQRAMDVFWSRGYDGTSLPDLLLATGLSRGSLYAAFGDKHGLFLRALDRYIDDALVRVDAELGSSGSPLAGLRACVEGYVDRTSGARGKRGCLVVATAMELAGRDPEAGRRIAGFFRSMEARLAGALTRARAAGELSKGIDPAGAAHLLLCFVEGLRVVGKTSPARSTTSSAVETLLARLAA